MGSIKIGKTSFHEESIKKMSLKSFKDTYKNILKGEDVEEVYKKITKKDIKKSSNTEAEDDNLG